MNSSISLYLCIHSLLSVKRTHICWFHLFVWFQNKQMRVKRIQSSRHCLTKSEEKESYSLLFFLSDLCFVTLLFSQAFRQRSGVTTFARGWRRTATDCHTLPTKNFISHIINLGNYAADKYNSVVAAASVPAAMKADATTFRTTVRAANSRFPILLRSPVPACRTMKHNGWFRGSISSRCNALRPNCRIPK